MKNQAEFILSGAVPKREIVDRNVNMELLYLLLPISGAFFLLFSVCCCGQKLKKMLHIPKEVIIGSYAATRLRANSDTDSDSSNSSDSEDEEPNNNNDRTPPINSQDSNGNIIEMTSLTTENLDEEHVRINIDEEYERVVGKQSIQSLQKQQSQLQNDDDEYGDYATSCEMSTESIESKSNDDCDKLQCAQSSFTDSAYISKSVYERDKASGKSFANKSIAYMPLHVRNLPEMTLYDRRICKNINQKLQCRCAVALCERQRAIYKTMVSMPSDVESQTASSNFMIPGPLQCLNNISEKYRYQQEPNLEFFRNSFEQMRLVSSESCPNLKRITE